MKRNLKLFVLVVCFGMFMNVNAIDYGVKTLIPINESANIKTDYFTYNGISYGGVDSSGHTLFNFSSSTSLSRYPLTLYRFSITSNIDIILPHFDQM